jgi:hypothetical protein
MGSLLRIVTKRNPLYTRQEVWFYRGEPVARTNNDLFYDSFLLPDFAVDAISQRQTAVIDLRRTEDALLADIKSGYRNEIRRATREGVLHHVDLWPPTSSLQRYLDSYRRFAHTKGLRPLDFGRLAALSRRGSLSITTAQVAGEDITYHSYLVDPGQRARLLYSHHDVRFTSDVERARINKFHHWHDMLFFRQAGVAHYDWGGVDFAAPAGIASFKMAFGGVLEQHYNFQRTRGLYSLVRWKPHIGSRP